MLLDLLGKLHEVLANCKVSLNDSQINELESLLQFHHKGIIPASVVRRELKISYEETHKLMIFLMTQGYLKSKYRIYCENDVFTGGSNVYDDPSQIPVEVCDRCEKGCALIKNLMVEFEVCE